MQVKFKSWVFWLVIISPVLAAVATALYIREQNQQGERDWERCQADLKAKGESINWNDFVPTPIPADQNFFTAPKMQAWFVEDRQKTNNELVLAMANPETDAYITNTAEAAAYIAWANQLEPRFKLIQEALKRPQQRMDGAYSDPLNAPKPDFHAFRATSEVLWQRARCELVLNHPDKAFMDLTFLFELGRVLNPPPSVKGGTLAAAISESTIVAAYASTIAIGLDFHAWNTMQLKAFEGQMKQIDLLSSLAGALAYDRTSSCYMAEHNWTLLSKRRLTHPIMFHGSLSENLTLISTWDEREIESIDLKARQIHPREINAVEAEKAAIKHTTSRNVIAVRTTLPYSTLFKSLAAVQVMADQARIACALESYRLAHGQYPLFTTSLVPEYINRVPNDIIGGKPMIYLRRGKDDFLLYSVGWNEIDDGGTVARDAKGKRDDNHRDWVW